MRLVGAIIGIAALVLSTISAESLNLKLPKIPPPKVQLPKVPKEVEDAIGAVGRGTRQLGKQTNSPENDRITDSKFTGFGALGVFVANYMEFCRQAQSIQGIELFIENNGFTRFSTKEESDAAIDEANEPPYPNQEFHSHYAQEFHGSAYMAKEKIDVNPVVRIVEDTDRQVWRDCSIIIDTQDIPNTNIPHLHEMYAPYTPTIPTVKKEDGYTVVAFDEQTISNSKLKVEITRYFDDDVVELSLYVKQ